MDFDLQPTLKGTLIDVRPLRSEDFEALFVAASDPLIWEQHPERDRYKREVFQAFFDGAIASRGALAVVERASARIIGSSRYCNVNMANREVEIGFTFLERKFWGGRYNGELKTLMVDHAFRFVDSVVFIVGETNLRSQRALHKIGATLVGEKELPSRDGAAIPCVVLRIQAPIARRGSVRIHQARPDEAQEVRRIMQEAFAEYRDRLTPPTGALTETVEDVRNAMAAGGALLAFLDDAATGTVRYQIRTDHLYAERLGVLPEYRRRGISAALMSALDDLARQAALPEIRLCVRASLPSNLRFYENLGYRAFESSPHPRGPDFVITLRKQF